MGKQYKVLTKDNQTFIRAQKVFFIASCSGKEVNLSPKGYDSIYLQDESTLYMLDFPGSGNRTARDLKEQGDVTLVFTAFEGEPQILRLFCKGEVLPKHDPQFQTIFTHFDVSRSTVRQLFKFTITTVESSCGMSIPVMPYERDREDLKEWIDDQVEDGTLKSYIQKHETPPTL